MTGSPGGAQDLSVREWLVAADDRTGALEVAAGIAAHLGPTVVAVGNPTDGSCVVDIGSRSLGRSAARQRAATMEQVPARLSAHKIDSTLRGNWAHEVVARCQESGRRLLVVPAWPAMGRTCRDGVVHVHGEPHDAVARHLDSVRQLRPDSLEDWLTADTDDPRAGRAVVDVVDTHMLDAVCSTIAAHRAFLSGEVLLAASAAPIAGVIGGALTAQEPLGVPSAVRQSFGSLPARLSGAVIVVSGSATGVSDAQLAAVRRERSDVEVFAAVRKEGPLHPSVARDVVRRARCRIAEGGVGAVVVVGGSTAALLLGDEPRTVHGTVVAGLPWSRPLVEGSATGPVVVSKAGGFGSEDTLVEALDVLESWRS